MSTNILQRLPDVQPLQISQADSVVCDAQPGQAGNGDGPADGAYWDGWAAGHAAGAAHGQRLAEIGQSFNLDEARRLGFQEGRLQGIAECGWVRLLRDVWSAAVNIFWILIFVGIVVAILADTYLDGKKAGREEIQRSSKADKIGALISTFPQVAAR